MRIYCIRHIQHSLTFARRAYRLILTNVTPLKGYAESPAHKYKARVKVGENNKRTSLLHWNNSHLKCFIVPTQQNLESFLS
jgi:hypothetical protein